MKMALTMASRSDRTLKHGTKLDLFETKACSSDKNPLGGTMDGFGIYTDLWQWNQVKVMLRGADDDMYLGQGNRPDLDTLPKDTALESKAFKVHQRLPIEITSKCNPLD